MFNFFNKEQKYDAYFLVLAKKYHKKKSDKNILSKNSSKNIIEKPLLRDEIHPENKTIIPSIKN